jgi:FkbM family methyltransferase
MVTALARQGIGARTVIDVGANRGQFSVAVRNILHPSRIHAFEPLPEAADALVRHCAGYREVEVHAFALGATSGHEILHVNAHRQSSSLLPLGSRHLGAFPRATEIATVDVEVRRLDDVLVGTDLEPPVLMKVDTQGFELPVLHGAECTRSAIDYLILETSFSPLYDGEQSFLTLLDQLRGMGFTFVRPVGSLRDPVTREFLQIDALFSRNS